MALEAGDGFISGLVITNPVNATDQVAQGDDHLRLIKTALKGTFPNLNAAVNATPAQLNVLATDGAGAGMLANIAAIADPGADRILGWDESANDAIAFSLSTGLTTSGTALLIDTAVVPRLNAANVFSVQQIIRAANPYLHIDNTSASADSGDWLFLATGDRLELGAYSDSLGSSANWGRVLRTGVVIDEVELNATTFDLNGNLDLSGTVTSPGTAAAEVGYNGTPQNAQAGNYTLVLADRGKVIYKASGGAGETITIPANGSVAFPVGTIIRIVNNGGGDLTIAITTDTLSLAGAGTTGSRTLADHGVAIIEKVASTEWFISGVGLS